MKKQNTKTLNHQIFNDIQNNIISGIWPPGYRLPFEIDLAKQYGCSRMTVNKVMIQLVSNGMIERKRKSGSFVRFPSSQSAILPINEISTEVEAMGLKYNWKIIDCKKHTSNEVDSKRLNVKKNTAILSVICLHFANDKPFCLEQRIININAVKNVEGADFTKIPPGNWLVEMVPWSSAQNRISAISADGHISKSLEISEHFACLLVERLTRNNLETITYVRLIYSGKQHSIVALFEQGNALTSVV